MVQPGDIMMAVVVLGAGTIVLRPIASALARRIEAKASAGKLSARDTESDERLRRIETAVDAMSVEIERMAEHQRFLTRVLAERPPGAGALPPGEPGVTRQASTGGPA